MGDIDSLGPHTDGQPGLSAFGLGLLTELAPPGAWVRRPPLPGPRLQIRSVSARAIADSWSGLDEIGWQGAIDGAPFVVERGVGGDHRFVHGTPPGQGGARSDGNDKPPRNDRPPNETRAIHHLSADAGLLQCAPADPADPSWWRVVLDSALFTVALLRGYEALHSGAVATPEGAIAIAAATGGGKSTLLTELLGRGHALLADDVLVLEPRGEQPPLAHPGPPLMTVPANRLPALHEQSHRPGRRPDPPQEIASLGDERWIAVPVHPEPLPLRALVVLDRRPASQPPGSRTAGSGPETGSGSPGSGPATKPTLERIEDPLAPLLGTLIGFPRSPERRRTRFELASVLAGTIALWRLTAPLDTPPEVLADALLAGVL